jgi:hypothetical protein
MRECTLLERGFIAAIVCCRHLLVRSLACASIAALAATAHADDERLEVGSATVDVVQGVLLLNAQLELALPEGARQAVRDGVELTLDIELKLYRERSFWLDDAIATLEQRYELSYHALTERYVVRNRNSGAQSTYATLDEALDQLRTIRSLPILDQSLLDLRRNYEARLRATLDIHTLPGSLRVVLFWTDDWQQRSDWYAWPLKP